MNKAELIEALSGRLGDRKSATAALDAVLAEIQNAVTKGDKVSITGFGVFEKRVRAARTARNPRTGESVKVKKTSVPAFRPGASFKELVAAGRVPKATKAAAREEGRAGQGHQGRQGDHCQEGGAGQEGHPGAHQRRSAHHGPRPARKASGDSDQRRRGTAHACPVERALPGLRRCPDRVRTELDGRRRSRRGRVSANDKHPAVALGVW